MNHATISSRCRLWGHVDVLVSHGGASLVGGLLSVAFERGQLL